ncbi:MAG: metal-dependent transcriptional regulator [Planctomycetota bacterium]|jgi:DtxR family Mn-dependent transcriptional regulator
MKLRKGRPVLTESLEDYLETIYVLVRDRKVARVKEIAKARGVRMASVTTAMHRLSEMELIHYNQREFIELTTEGEEMARRIMARHDLLIRFFTEILHVPTEIAETDACAVEHNLSDESVDRMVRFFEYLRQCPKGEKGQKDFLDSFHNCSVVNPEMPSCKNDCPLGAPKNKRARKRQAAMSRQLSDLSPGETSTIVQVQARGAVRQRLIDMGMLPNVRVEVERKAPGGNPIWIKLKGFQLSLRREEAAGVRVSP